MTRSDFVQLSDRGAAARRGVEASARELVAMRGEAPRLALHPPRRARAALAGPYLSTHRGRGLEFEEVRAYQPGDDVRAIDWRVTARTGRVHSKVFRDDRESRIWVMLDAGPSMRFGTRRAFKSVAAARAAALLAWSAQSAGDCVGGLVISSDRAQLFQPRPQQAALLALLGAMARATSSRGDAPALSTGGCLEMLRQHAGPGSRVFVLSDFYGLDDSARRHLGALARRCDVTCILVYDALEAEPPPAGRYRVSDGEKVRAISTEVAAQRVEYAARFTERRADLRGIARKHHIQLAALRTDDDPAEALAALHPVRTTRGVGRSH